MMFLYHLTLLKSRSLRFSLPEKSACAFLRPSFPRLNAKKGSSDVDAGGRMGYVRNLIILWTGAKGR